MTARLFIRALAGALGLALAAGPATAQEWPAKTLRIVVAYPAGGGVDFVARTVGQRLGERLKQTVVIDNRAGASGSIGTDSVAKSAPDGYTLLLASPAEVIVGPAAGQKTPYKPETDLVPVALIGETPLVLAVHAGVEARDLPGFIAQLKAQPAKYSYGTPGSGSSMHFAGEAFKSGTATDLQHVPYRGAAPAINDALGGQITAILVGMPPVVPHAKSGRLRVLAVTTAKRSPLMPEVPAIAELPGMKDYRFSNWMMLFAPARTAPAVLARLGQEIGAVLAEPAIRERLGNAGVEPMGLLGSAAADFLAEERKRYAGIASAHGIRFEE